MLISISSLNAGFFHPGARFIVKVVDELNSPIPNISVSMYPIRLHKVYSSKTNENGICKIKGATDFMGSIWLEKKNYYTSTYGFEFEKVNRFLMRWEPYPSKLTVVLRKKKNPIPMYAKKVENLKIPVLDKPVGYDLEKGDWVKPYGKGIISDFIFNPIKMKLKSWNYYDCKMLIYFNNEQNGLQNYEVPTDIQSKYIWSYEPPKKIYGIKKLERISYCLPPEHSHLNNSKENAKYIFRVRTKVDKDGNIISACYGKISRGFTFSIFKNVCSFSFTYYFNPTGTRNLEYDPSKNLFIKELRGEFIPPWEDCDIPEEYQIMKP